VNSKMLASVLFIWIFSGWLPCSSQVTQGAGFDPSPIQIVTANEGKARAITSLDLLTLRDVHGVSISPDGNYVAVVIGQAVYETNSYRSSLLVVGTKPGSVPVIVGTAGMPHWDMINQWLPEAPQWSPDSRYLTYRARIAPSEEMQVWRWKFKREAPVRLTHVPGDVTKYEWMRDGSGLVLTVQKKRDPGEIKSIAEHGVFYDGSFPVWNRQSTVDAVLEWRPEEYETWLHRFATGEERRATPEEARSFGPWESDLKDKVLTRPQDLDETHRILDAKVSPDGSMVAYRYFLNDPAQSRQISYVLFAKPARGGTPVRLTSLTGYLQDYWWSQDSKRIFYTVAEGGGRAATFRVTPADGGTARELVSGGDYLDNLSMDRRERYVACTRENNTTPQQVALLDLESGNMRTLVDLNPEFKNIQLSPVTRIEGINRLGEPWFGHLVKPLLYEPGKRYPLIIATYRSGGYFLRGASGDQSPLQVYAAHGFAVLSLDVGPVRDPENFEGFRMLWASPLASMEQAVEKLSQSGLIDPQRIGATGYSFGETILGFAISHTDLFRAASGVASYDPLFEYYLADDGFRATFRKWGLGNWLQEPSGSNWSEVSLILKVDRVHTPILNQAGDFEGLGDQPLLVGLKELHKPVELYLYPNELHHKNQPKHRYEIYERNLDWFRFWLSDEEDSMPAKKEQYERWHRLREQLRTEGHPPAK